MKRHQQHNERQKESGPLYVHAHAPVARPAMQSSDSLSALINRILGQHAEHRVNGAVASARTQQVTHEVIHMCFKRLHKLGLKIQDPANIAERHIEALVKYWWSTEGKKRIAPATLRNYMSRLRIFCGYLGKSGMVKDAAYYLPREDPTAFKVHAAAQTSKSWTAVGVDVREKFKEADSTDRNFGLMLRLELGFGLRRKEVLHCMPWQHDCDTYLVVREGKNGLARNISITTPAQRELLDYVKANVKKTERLGWTHTRRGRVATLEANEDRYSALMRRIGMTKDIAGATGHGLRSGYAENAALDLGFMPGTFGGTARQMDVDQLTWRRTQLSHSLGHFRISITAAYLGALLRGQRFHNPWRSGALILRALDVLGHEPSKLPPMERSRTMDCVKIVTALMEISVNCSPVQAQALWKIHANRNGVEWFAPGTEIIPALELAAKSVLLIQGGASGDAPVKGKALSAMFKLELVGTKAEQASVRKG